MQHITETWEKIGLDCENLKPWSTCGFFRSVFMHRTCISILTFQILDDSSDFRECDLLENVFFFGFFFPLIWRMQNRENYLQLFCFLRLSTHLVGSFGVATTRVVENCEETWYTFSNCWVHMSLSLIVFVTLIQPLSISHKRWKNLVQLSVPQTTSQKNSVTLKQPHS